MRSININGQHGQVTNSFPGGNFTSQKSLAQHGQPNQYKTKVNRNYQNAQSPKHSMSHEGGTQPSFGISNSNLSGPSTYSPKKVVSNLPEIVEFDPDYLEIQHTEGTDKAEPSLTRLESLEDTGDLDFADRNSQPRAVRKLSYSKNRGQEFYPTELGTVTSEQTKDSLEAQYMQSPQPQLIQPLVQSRLFNPITQGVGAPWTPSPALAGMYPQFQALMPGYPAFQTGVPMQTFTLPDRIKGMCVSACRASEVKRVHHPLLHVPLPRVTPKCIQTYYQIPRVLSTAAESPDCVESCK